MDVAKNFAKTTVSDGNYDSDDTEIDLIPGDGEKLPSATPYNAVWWNATDYPDPADDPNAEIVRVTDRTDDTLTITRAQEGTAAVDHNVAGKTYKLIAGLTAKSINDETLPVSRSGDHWSAISDGGFGFIVNDAVSGFTAFQLTPSNGQYALGDIDANNSGVAFIADDTEGHLLMRGPLATDQIVSASGPVGTVVGKVALRDDTGTIIGYLPVYGSIT